MPAASKNLIHSEVEVIFENPRIIKLEEFFVFDPVLDLD